MMRTLLILLLFPVGASAAINGSYQGQGNGSLESGWKGGCYFYLEVKSTSQSFEVVHGKNLCGDFVSHWPPVKFQISGMELVDESGESVGMILPDSVTYQTTDPQSGKTSAAHLKKMPMDDKMTFTFDDVSETGQNSFMGLLSPGSMSASK